MSDAKPNTPGEQCPFSTTHVLDEEFEAIWGAAAAETARADSQAGSDQRLAAIQSACFELGQSALCLSGGGIRSASFSLGVLQALAARGLLTQFQYLSTVSGGGYIGGFLSRWIHDLGHDRDGKPIAGKVEFAADLVEASLGRAGAAGSQVQHLREYSNFVTPKVGLTSADTWTAAAIWIRNVLVNWLVFGPALLIAVAVPHIYSHCVALARSAPADSPVLRAVLFVGAAFLTFAVFRSCVDLPSYAGVKTDSDKHPDSRPNGHKVFTGIAIPAFIWALLAPLALAPVTAHGVPATGMFLFRETFLTPLAALLIGYAIAGVVVRLRGQNASAFVRNADIWLMASAASAATLSLSFYGIARFSAGWSTDWHNNIAASLGPLVAVVAQLLPSIIYVAFRRTDDTGQFLATDLDREWLARLSAIKLRPAVAWFVVSGCVLIVSRVLLGGEALGDGIVWGTTLSTAATGLIAVLGGKSSATTLVSTALKSKKLVTANLVIALATLAFAVLLLGVLSRAYADMAARLAAAAGWTSLQGATFAQFVVFAVLALLLWRTSERININRFSLNGLYRNRLCRAFLGAGNARRDPDPFTGFDVRDNVRMHCLQAYSKGRRVLFPVINLALNVVGTKTLAWQERKAGPFIVTPLSCGSALLNPADLAGGPEGPVGAFVQAQDYGGNEHDVGLVGTGMSLATAMAISGAAATPSMGYHSSPATAFIMTLFNVRLGAWMPNPARAGDLCEAMKKSGPTNSLLPFLREMAGLTTDTGADIYLSDGGHFENLGLYEMVRRRCRYIVVVDAGCDPDCRLEDLGNAIRKIAIDQAGIEIKLQRIETIRARATVASPRYAYAVGEIRYPGLAEPGRLLYIKPSYLDDMPLDVRAYAAVNEAFPHESTADQWFSESQMESYRQLGHSIVSGLVEPQAQRLTLPELFGGIDGKLSQIVALRVATPPH